MKHLRKLAAAAAIMTMLGPAAILGCDHPERDNPGPPPGQTSSPYGGPIVTPCSVAQAAHNDCPSY